MARKSLDQIFAGAFESMRREDKQRAKRCNALAKELTKAMRSLGFVCRLDPRRSIHPVLLCLPKEERPKTGGFVPFRVSVMEASGLVRKGDGTWRWYMEEDDEN